MFYELQLANVWMWGTDGFEESRVMPHPCSDDMLLLISAPTWELACHVCTTWSSPLGFDASSLVHSSVCFQAVPASHTPGAQLWPHLQAWTEWQRCGADLQVAFWTTTAATLAVATGLMAAIVAFARWKRLLFIPDAGGRKN